MTRSRKIALALGLILVIAGVVVSTIFRSKDDGGPPAAGSVDGAALVQRYACFRCHGWDRVGILDDGPALDHAGDKLRAEWIGEFLRDPSASRMPRIADMTDEDRKTLSAFVLGLHRDRGFPKAAKGNPGRGALLYEENECSKCHNPDRPDPDLDPVPRKIRRDWLVAYLLNPAEAQPRARMPSYQFPQQDAEDLAAFLLKDAGAAGQPLADAKGLDTFVRLRCITCHAVEKFRGKEMTAMLAGSPNMGLHRKGNDGVPRIALTGEQEAAVWATLRAWTATPATGADLLAATGFEDYTDDWDDEDDGADSVALEGFEDYWTLPVPVQGEPPKTWTGLERSLHPSACAVCHPLQHYDWKDSLHARAYSYGFRARSTRESCRICHTPLKEQYGDAILQTSGVSCAACHVRSHRRYGPPLAEHDLLEPNRMGHHDAAVRSEFFAAADFCARCHQFGEGEGRMMKGKMIMNTLEEWKLSPAAKEGKTCQSCHMPDRRHLWRGIHDPEMVRKYLKVQIQGRKILLTSSAGHRMPTYVVPKITVSAWLEDGQGRQVPQSRRSWPVQRKVVFGGSLGGETFDTRLVPGETREFEYDLDKQGATLVVSVDVEPDAHYRQLYKGGLQKTFITEEIRALLQAALREPMAPAYNVTTLRAPFR